MEAHERGTAELSYLPSSNALRRTTQKVVVAKQALTTGRAECGIFDVVQYRSARGTAACLETFSHRPRMLGTRHKKG